MHGEPSLNLKQTPHRILTEAATAALVGSERILKMTHVRTEAAKEVAPAHVAVQDLADALSCAVDLAPEVALHLGTAAVLCVTTDAVIETRVRAHLLGDAVQGMMAATVGRIANAAAADHVHADVVTTVVLGEIIRSMRAKVAALRNRPPWRRAEKESATRILVDY